MLPVRLEHMTSPSIPLSWEEEMPFELQLIGTILKERWQHKLHLGSF